MCIFIILFFIFFKSHLTRQKLCLKKPKTLYTSKISTARGGGISQAKTIADSSITDQQQGEPDEIWVETKTSSRTLTETLPRPGTETKTSLRTMTRTESSPRTGIVTSLRTGTETKGLGQDRDGGKDRDRVYAQDFAQESLPRTQENLWGNVPRGGSGRLTISVVSCNGFMGVEF